MTLHELADSLPNGFHDAEVRTLAVDFNTRVATLELDIWIGEPEEAPETGHEWYRAARLHLRGLAYLVSDPPDPRYAYATPGSIRVDLCDADPAAPLPPPRPGEFAARFFVSTWNAFISVAAQEAALEWTGEPFNEQSPAGTVAPPTMPR